MGNITSQRWKFTIKIYISELVIISCLCIAFLIFTLVRFSSTELWAMIFIPLGLLFLSDLIISFKLIFVVKKYRQALEREKKETKVELAEQQS